MADYFIPIALAEQTWADRIYIGILSDSFFKTLLSIIEIILCLGIFDIDLYKIVGDL